MAIIWDSLHFSSEQSADTLTTWCAETITMLGYTLYNPFTALTGKAYAQSIRLFLSDCGGGWWRLIGEFPADLPAHLASDMTILHLHLRDTSAEVRVFADNTQRPLIALTDWLGTGYTLADLDRALAQTIPPPPPQAEMPLHALPDDVQRMAQGVNPKHMNRMFQKIMGGVSKVMGGNLTAANALLQPTLPDWGRDAGAKISTFMRCLNIPEGWHTPDFITLRDAYQLHRRLERHPNAPLLAGDREAMNAVPDALRYIPIYGGK